MITTRVLLCPCMAICGINYSPALSLSLCVCVCVQQSLDRHLQKHKDTEPKKVGG